MDNAFLCGLSGTVVTPCDESYSEDRRGYNRAVQQYPLIINYCKTPYDVACAVRWARRNNAEVRVRCGGHNYEGYSNGNAVVVIDVSQMTDIKINTRSKTVRVQGGVTNKLLYDFLASRGFPFPGGTCPTVGVAGYALGGGWGLSCRALGLGCDSIKEVELVNYEGRLIKANSRCRRDLFWALRGAGGGNFGVVTSITFALPPRVQHVTLIEIDYLHVDKSTQEEFLQTWQEWVPYADRRLTLIARIYNSEEDGLSMLVRGIFYGDPGEAASQVKKFLDISGSVSNIEKMTFAEAMNILGSGYPPYQRFQSASRFVYAEFRPQEINDIVGIIQNRPKGSVYAALSLYALGGRVSEIGMDETAFFHRCAKYIMWLESIFDDNMYSVFSSSWIDRMVKVIEPLTKGAYVNFPYAGLCDFKTEYYGKHADRLIKIKRKYDPCDVFTFPQGLSRCDTQNVPKFISADEPKIQTPEKTYVPAEEKPNYRGFRYVSPKN